jgi:hypothetical protein
MSLSHSFIERTSVDIADAKNVRRLFDGRLQRLVKLAEEPVDAFGRRHRLRVAGKGGSTGQAAW